MEILISVLGVVVAAFGIWLVVRIVNRRERWAKWTAAVLFVVLVLYPLSSGPADWLFFHGYLSKPVWHWGQMFYSPCGLVLRNSPKPILDAYNRYDKFWVNLGDPPRPPINVKRRARAPVNPPAPTPDAPAESD